MAKIYALLVGINKYPQVPLKGCINDVNAVEQYLKDFYGNKEGIKLEIARYSDAEPTEEQKPTRKNIISAFEKHFATAEDGDTCVFYYSGHGSYAAAPAGFWVTGDGNNQSFVCIDSRTGAGDIIDKEMSYLVWKTFAARPRVLFVAITDCCHSGTIMKAINREEGTDRMMPGQHLPAKIEDYLGYNDTTEINGECGYIKKDGKVSVNVVPHIHIAAAYDNQTAKELSIDGEIRGAFTHSLIKVLRKANGIIDYRQLLNKTAALVKNRVPDQNPVLNQNGGINNSETEKTFLLQKHLIANPARLVYFNSEDDSWQIKAGILQGVKLGDAVQIPALNISVIVDKVNADFSTLTEHEALSQRTEQYEGLIMFSAEGKIDLGADSTVDTDTLQLLNQQINKEPLYFKQIEPNSTGSYVVRSINGLQTITLAASENAIIAPTSISDENTAAKFLGDINAVRKWMQLRELNNASTNLTDKDYTVEFFVSQTPGDSKVENMRTADITKPVDFNYKDEGKLSKAISFAVKFTNKSATHLMVAPVFMEFDYGISNNNFDRVIHFPPGASGFLMNKWKKPMAEMTVDDNYRDLGYHSTIEYLKVFVSTFEINTNDLNQNGIELPPTDRNMQAVPITKSMRAVADTNDWTTETICLRTTVMQGDVKLSESKQVSVRDITVMPHTLQATIALSGSQQSLKSGTKKTPAALDRNAYLQPFNLSFTTRGDETLDLIELFDAKNIESVTPEKPLIFQLHTRLGEHESVIALGYDSVDDIYYPLGYSNGNTVEVVELPIATHSNTPITTRSIGGSIKLYFQKIVGQITGNKKGAIKLSIPEIMPGGEIDYKYDIDNIAKRVKETDKENIVIFIHGIIGETRGMFNCSLLPVDDTGSTLHNHALVLAVDYENLGTTIQQIGTDLRDALKAVGIKEGIQKNVVIAAHSMGGLVTRWFIEKAGGNKFVKNVVMYGTPNCGTPWASLRQMADTFLTYAINGSVVLQPYMLILTGLGNVLDDAQTTFKQMHPDSDFYKELNTGEDPKIPYTIVAGNTKNINPSYTKTGTFVEKWIKRFKSRFVYGTLDMTVFHSANDIAVSVDSIKKIEGYETWPAGRYSDITVDCDHLSYFVTPPIHVNNILTAIP